MTFIKYNKYNIDFSYMPWRNESEKWGMGRNRYRKRVRRQMWHRPKKKKKGARKKQEREIKRWEREKKENK